MSQEIDDVEAMSELSEGDGEAADIILLVTILKNLRKIIISAVNCY